MRRDAERLEDIIEAIDAVMSQSPDRARFDVDPLLRVWCLHHITIVGEAAARLSSETKAVAPDTPWRAIVAMRNAIVHGYFQVDWDAVWTVVDRDLPPLRGAVVDLLARIEGVD